MQQLTSPSHLSRAVVSRNRVAYFHPLVVTPGRMVHPDEFEEFRREGLQLGFKYVASGPLVRSSYKAGEIFLEAFVKDRQIQCPP